MKKWIWLTAVVSALVLAGCSSQETPVFETVGNISAEQPEPPAAGVIQMDLPQEAAAQTMDAEQEQLYTWEGYELRVTTQPAGDIAATMENLTGLDNDALTVMKQDKDDMTIYQTVWSSTGEDGIRCGRAMVADDGSYHYCMSLTNPEEVNAVEVYNRLADSFRVTPPDTVK